MLKKIWIPLFFFPFSLCYAAPTKIGVVDMQRIILTVEDGKTARQKLQETINAKEQEFKQQKTELDQMNTEWKSQAALLSEEARLRKQNEFQQKFMALRNAEMKFQGEIKQQETEATQKIAIRATELVNNIASKKGLDLVFETQSSGLMYAQNPVDLTDEVIKLYEMPQPGKKISTNKTSNQPKAD